MSGIYGIFRYDGRPLEHETLFAMRQAMAYYGPDGGGQWHEGPIGLGHLLLCVTPEDSFEVQPLTSHNITVVSFARLDNRDELLRNFAIPTSEQPTTPDSALVLRAYCRWGEECPAHINGDWQFAAWDEHNKTLFIARDHHGNTGLYYYKNSRFFAFASSIKALLAIPDIPRQPDMIKMAQVLTAWQGEGERTAYEGISRLPPAHTLRASTPGEKPKRYWFPEHLPIISFRNEQEYVDNFLDIYRQAVCSRLRSSRPIGVTLSGGLDSGSVTALAAPMLDECKKTLLAFTSVPLYDPSGAGTTRTGNEWELASATARMAGKNVNHIAINSEHSGVIAGIEHQLALHDSPGHAAGNQFWITSLLDLASRQNIGTLLTGQCGNASVSFDGNGQCLYHLLNGDVRSAVNTYLHADSNPLQAIKRQLLKPLLLPAIRTYRHKRLSDTCPWQDYSAISKEFADRIRLKSLMELAGHDSTFTYSPLQRFQLQIMRLGSNHLGANWHEKGAGYAMEIRDPTLDRRIIEYCLQIPDLQFRKAGESRRLMRRAMHGLLPPEVLNNTKKGLQAADIAGRLVAEELVVSQALIKLEQSPAAKECLDLPRMHHIFNTIRKSGNAVSAKRSITILLRGIGVGLFLADRLKS